MRRKCCGKILRAEKRVNYALILSPVAFDLVAFLLSIFLTSKNSFLLIAAPLTLSRSLSFSLNFCLFYEFISNIYSTFCIFFGNSKCNLLNQTLFIRITFFFCVELQVWLNYRVFFIFIFVVFKLNICIKDGYFIRVLILQLNQAMFFKKIHKHCIENVNVQSLKT